MRLLIVDDSPTIRKAVELTFRGTTFAVDFASSGREGIDAALASPPDALLLDFVLPDMRGLDVCAALAKSDRTRDVPILILSAKDEGIRKLFAGYSAVVDFVKKPFTGEELLARVRTATADEEGRPRPSRAPERFSRADRELAAKALYAALRRSFAFIPSWCAQMGNSPPAPFFARKMLTTDAMGDVLEALLPLFLAMEKNRATRPAAMQGVLHDWSLGDLIGLLGGSGRTGVLTIEHESEQAADITTLYWRSGEIVLVTAGEPGDVALGEGGTGGNGVDVGLALHQTSAELLRRALTSKPTSFAWQDLTALPSFVEAWGRYVPLPRDTLRFGPPPEGAPPASRSSLKSLTLELARAASHETEAAWPQAEMVLDRVRGFSQRLEGLPLDGAERRVLAVVTGRTTLREAAARAGLEEREARRLAHVLCETGLLGAAAGARPVLIVEPDVEGFQRPLQSLLARRVDPVPLLSFEAAEDLLAAAMRERPSLVIVNAGASSDVGDTARALRSRGELRAVPLVAVLELSERARAPELAAAGFDAVLVKPVAYADLERLIGS